VTIAKRVRDCRYAKGWGPDELASRAAISRTALYQIECGKTETPRAGTLRRIAQALEVSIETLLGTDEPRPFELATVGRSAGPSAAPRAGKWKKSRSGSPVPGREDGKPAEPAASVGTALASYGNPLLIAREGELQQKFHELLYSPFGEGLARIIEETYRLLPLRQERAQG
jgi:transcriptional regulator with XRE-family HTH domain